MSPLQERIEQFRKMASDDPDNELGHYRLGQLLMEAKQYEQAVTSFRRTLELSPHFSKVYQLLGQSLVAAGKTDEAIAVLKEGFGVADERGDKMPRDEMARALVELGQPTPASKKAAAPPAPFGPGTGFRCTRTMCLSGAHAHQLPKPPLPDAMGQRIQAEICADCWNDWFRNQSIKVINELRLDLSTERGQEEYDRYMSEFFGFES
jgi:tetratricopeptide (TPR) repeat protein